MTAAAQSHPSYEQLLDENAFLQRQLKELTEDKEHLQELLRHYQRQRFAPKSEVHGKGQGTLFNEAETLNAENAVAPGEEVFGPPKPKKRGKPVRKSLPESLPAIDTVIDLPESERVCPVTGAPLVKVGEVITEQLDIKPAEARRLRTIRPKYAPCACPDCTAKREAPAAAAEPVFKVAPLPPQPIPKSFASPGLLATIATAKYGDGLPLYRQEEILGRIGIGLTRQTLAGWMVRCGEIVKPLINLAKDELLSGPVILCDETRVQVLKGTGKKPTATSYMWCFMSGTERAEKITIFELGPSRSHEVPMAFLAGYEGYLHTDGYEAYETLAAKMPKIKLVGDWVHARRKFDEAIKAFPKDFKGEIKVKAGFDMITEIFRIDRDEISPLASKEERYRIRQEKSRPVVERLKTWADETLPTMRPKSLSGVALRYMLERWPKLILFLEDPILELGTNDVENAIRPFVMGRKAWLFSATVAGAEASAALYSLIAMAHDNDLNIYEYLKAVFTEMPKATTADEMEALLPWRWRPTAPLQ
jgi:transposase